MRELSSRPVEGNGLRRASRAAYLSPCRTWRYWLTREVASAKGCRAVAFIGLNPSTADETGDDPTVRRCLGFARAWGFARLRMLNLYAYRSADPRALRHADDPVGAENDQVIVAVSRRCDLVVAAWGAGAERSRIEAVVDLAPDLHCLGVTKGGFPRLPPASPVRARRRRARAAGRRE